ncbi:unnamed protein product [Moneuplotes crassus]|uniref:Uncharacterized protein n=1 Tax=Euplotes crassus TaxID=5936 RepID=A0AAD1XUP2_EUPCR|nr:unnamed protein product [Moneuplotes crassus]
MTKDEKITPNNPKLKSSEVPSLVEIYTRGTLGGACAYCLYRVVARAFNLWSFFYNTKQQFEYRILVRGTLFTGILGYLGYVQFRTAFELSDRRNVILSKEGENSEEKTDEEKLAEEDLENVSDREEEKNIDIPTFPTIFANMVLGGISGLFCLGLVGLGSSSMFGDISRQLTYPLMVLGSGSFALFLFYSTFKGFKIRLNIIEKNNEQRKKLFLSEESDQDQDSSSSTPPKQL